MAFRSRVRSRPTLEWKVKEKGSSTSKELEVSDLPKGAEERSAKVEKRYDELVLIIQCEGELAINAVSKDGDLIPKYSISTSPCSLPYGMGFAVVGSKLHMVGGFSPDDDKESDPYSLNTYVLDVHSIPALVESGKKLSSAAVDGGPRLNSPKIIPFVFVVQGHIYALSSAVHGANSTSSDFEVRALGEPEWKKLPNPPVPDDLLPYASLDSHTLVHEHHSIVISLYDEVRGGWRGAFIFSLADTTWTTLKDPIGFVDRPICRNGFCYAPSDFGLQVFKEGHWSIQDHELEIRKTSPLVRFYTVHAIVMLGDVTFIFRFGSPKSLSMRVFRRHFYVTMDRYKVSPSLVGHKHSIEVLDSKLNHSDYLLPESKAKAYEASGMLPYFLPVSL